MPDEGIKIAGRSLLEEKTMFQVTEKANEMIREFQKEKEEVPPIRLKLFHSG